MAGLRLGLELELGLGLWPGFIVRVSRVRVNVKATAGCRVSDHVRKLQSSCKWKHDV